ncbi:TPA: hypothetical protein DCX16_03930 [bacterium]|nr:hypothetical protein [bacterium]
MGFFSFIKRKKEYYPSEEIDFEPYIDEFLSKKQPILNPKVSENAGFILKTLFDYYKKNPTKELSKIELANLAFKISRRIPINRKTGKDILNLIRAFFIFLEEKGVVERNQIEEVFREQDLKFIPQEPVVRTSPKTGRNEPCSCGSKKKYKFCCGR